ncbi:glycosyl hydrolase family 18 protein [Pedobacter sp. L105]|uniref:glycosyl hydrolase family 18 protein n=1 Tax=Pedobacter sp. L105 TaxID=1641871 RepID=UPI00131B4C59|nr:glycosyl hydrolase family 18 protein [Pedobacter sp. L105]
MKNRFWIAVLFIVVILGVQKSSAGITLTVPGKNPGFKIIGYLLQSDIAAGNAANFDFTRITHLNVAFINPDQNGNFPVFSGLSTIIATAHQKNVKVMASIGGGSAPAYYATLLADSSRNDFIKKLVEVAVTNGFDGVDVDLESTRIDNNYENFVTGLAAALKLKGKMITAAVATAYGTQYTDKALSQFDFINIMSYDKTGPWNLSNPGQDAPYDMAVDDLTYWSTTRGIKKDKLNLGVPFYGYGFGTNAPSSISFKNLVAQYPGAENTDQVTLPGGGIIYYNGIPTIKSKVQLALQKAGGVMMWQLLQDTTGDLSLLHAINATIAGHN